MITYKAELKILNIGVPKFLEPNTRIMEQGKPANYLYFLKKGKVNIQGKNINKTVSEQEFFGLNEIVGHLPFLFNITALTEIQLIEIPEKALLNLIEEDAEVRRFMLIQLCRNIEMHNKEYE